MKNAIVTLPRTRWEWIAFCTLVAREMWRFLHIWRQTIVTPTLTTSLYLLIFGISLGRRIDLGPGILYLHFIIPGLMMMAVINSAVANASATVYQMKNNGSIVDLLVSPLRPSLIAVALAIAGTIRGLVVASLVMMVGFYLGVPFPHQPLLALMVALLTGWMFSCFGAIVGIQARRYEHMHSYTTMIITPLTYLGGVFYTLHVLPVFWQQFSRLNPIFYIIDSFRYAFLGFSDLHPWRSVAIIVAVTVAMSATLVHVLVHSRRLRA